MRNRHLPRLCRNCQAPMAGHEDTCWRCGAQWASEEAPPTTLRLVSARSSDQIRLDAERWTNEGGSFASDAAAPLAAVSAARGG
jgi:hypothetical protein